MFFIKTITFFLKIHVFGVLECLAGTLVGHSEVEDPERILLQALGVVGVEVDLVLERPVEAREDHAGLADGQSDLQRAGDQDVPGQVKSSQVKSAASR